MVITFAGHGNTFIDTELSARIKDSIMTLVKNEKFVSFYCGGYGNFDEGCAAICRELRPKIAPCEIVLVTPYLTITQQEKLVRLKKLRLYDSFIYPPLENVPPKFAISKRNEWMISEADVLICFVSHSFGGAYKSLKYAKRKNKYIIIYVELISQNKKLTALPMAPYRKSVDFRTFLEI